MVNIVWQRRRNGFNHDWLKNIYIPNLGAYINVLEGNIEDKAFEEIFINNILTSFDLHISDALYIVDNIKAEISPRVLFYERPFIDMDNDIKNLLSDIAYYLWIEKYMIENIIAEAGKSIDNAVRVYQKIMFFIDSTEIDKNELSSIKKNLFIEFLSSCRLLSKSIEKIPSEIKLV